MSDNTKEKPVYIKTVELENYGPFDKIKYDFRFDENGNPIPLILIGKNGSGKSIFLSHIVNALIVAKQQIYENCEVEKGRVYKLRSVNYIKSGAMFSRSKVEFTKEGAFLLEWVLSGKKKDLVELNNILSSNLEWAKISEDDTDIFEMPISKTVSDELINKGCVQYFPANRFDEPAWLNEFNLTSRVEYMDLIKLRDYSNRSIISLSKLKELQKWLFEVLVDRAVLESKTIGTKINEHDDVTIPIWAGYEGDATTIYDEILKLLNQVFGEQPETLRFGLGSRQARELSIMKNERKLIQNLFQLSSGETLLLSLFLCIIKDFDLSHATFSSLSNINGIVLVDEIDLHLHTSLQKNILPQLIKMFPKIQFVITTHSPMFLVGMQNNFGTDGFDIIEAPSFEPISVENFTEYQDIFSTIRDTKTFQNEITSKIKESQLPIVAVEGGYDIKYLTKAMEFFYKDEELLKRFRFFDAEGFGGLNKIWTAFDSELIKTLSARVLLLYDCDITKQDYNKGNAVRKTMPYVENPIDKGIENLLSLETIHKLASANSRFIDITEATSKMLRGEKIDIPKKYEVNKDEKRNICDWLCKNGDESDFEGFKVVINIIIDFLNHQ